MPAPHHVDLASSPSPLDLASSPSPLDLGSSPSLVAGAGPLPGRTLGADDLTDRPARWPAQETARLDGRISSFVRHEVTSPTGETLVREWLTHPGAVAVIALDDQDRVAVVTQYRHPAGHVLVEPPAGLLDHENEDYLVAAQRELAEEAMLQAADWRVLVDVFTSPGCNQESIRVFLARELAPAPRPEGFVLEGEEASMGVAWAKLEDLVEGVLAGRLQCPTMVSGVLALRTAQLTGSLDRLRLADAPWPARLALI